MTTQSRELESTRIAAALRDEILDGVRVGGSKLVERELAADFDVSRIPVRDALKVLEAEGLVTVRPRTWAIVREFTGADLAELDEVRSVLEPLAFRLVAERVGGDGLARLREVVAVEQAAAVAGDTVGSRRAGADFHELVIELSGNTLLGELATVMRSRLRWLMSQHDELADVSDDHAELVEAIAARDVERVTELAQAHLVRSKAHRETHERARRAPGVG